MLILAIILFAVGAIFGLIILTSFLKGGATPKGAVVVHGILVVIALILVIVFTVSHQPAPITALILFIITGLGGITLFAIDMSKKPLPKFLAFLHPILAVISLILLIIWVASPHGVA